ncbi:hypothetical protein B0T17DRAFT_621714 [Bombardia bombarda]|uniref:PH domain-containing protein n=1 Tax=Bombardia bombarda TaxID=252184 RepID=A0AA39U0P9_9PEZI|nr:hypothetical protein B0T17DRAFT_621714 [Bombardia bombarda]
MAGIEQLEIHSKSYIVRWVKVEEGHTISWRDDPNSTDNPTEGVVDNTKQGLFAKKDASTAQDQLAKKGFIPIKWHGKCEADKVSMGTYDVKSAGMFGLVFDNTFSKQTSKTATFVLLTYPTGAPPQTTHHCLTCKLVPMRVLVGRAWGSTAVLGSAPWLGICRQFTQPPRAQSSAGKSDGGSSNSYHVGTLHKRRRKKGQGYARRFFSLDYTTCTLSYYHNRNSVESREFSDWARALERASRVARGLETVISELPAAEINHSGRPTVRTAITAAHTRHDEDREWNQVETLVSRIVGTRDALRRLVKDMAAQKAARTIHPTFCGRIFPDYSNIGNATPIANGNRRMSRMPMQEEDHTYDNCTAILKDLDSVVVEFSSLLASSKRRRIPIPGSSALGRATSRPRLKTKKIPGLRRRRVSIHESSSMSSMEDDETMPMAPRAQAASSHQTKVADTPAHHGRGRQTQDNTRRHRATAKPHRFVRKNVGKDLSTISMPVSANEPLSLLQRVSEQLEYAQLLNVAARKKEANDRLLYVTAFAISQFSNGRAKERAIRKPFNPLLGETYELVRSEAEADSAAWSFAQSPAPTQKFWGKSAEITTDGRCGGHQIAIDRGGTFTDCRCALEGSDASCRTSPARHPARQPLDTAQIDSIRMGRRCHQRAAGAQGETIAMVDAPASGTARHRQPVAAQIFDLASASPTCSTRPSSRSTSAHARDYAEDPTRYATKADVRAGTAEQGLVISSWPVGEAVRILQRPERDVIRGQLQEVFDSGIRSIAVCLMHAYTFPDHEALVASSSRATSVCADAYLTPAIKKYIQASSGIAGGLGSKGVKQGEGDRGARCEFMQSDGGLRRCRSFTGSRPSCRACGRRRRLRYYVTTTAGSPSSLRSWISTRLPPWRVDALLPQRLVVGPNPLAPTLGPRLSKGGPATVTDANLYLAGCCPSLPKIFGKNEDEGLDETGKSMSADEVAYGFLTVANEAMTRPIRSITEAKAMTLPSIGWRLLGEVPPGAEGPRFEDSEIVFEEYLNMRYRGTESALNIKPDADGGNDWDFGQLLSSTTATNSASPWTIEISLWMMFVVRGSRKSFRYDEKTVDEQLKSVQRQEVTAAQKKQHSQAQVYFAVSPGYAHLQIGRSRGGRCHQGPHAGRWDADIVVTPKCMLVLETH